MTNAPTKSFTHTHLLGEDGSEDGTVEFHCSTDSEAWPWLKLQVHHPAAVQAVHFWASVGASIARGTFDTEKWSALTWTRWEISDRAAGQPVRGTMAQGEELAEARERLTYKLALFDADERLAYEVEGKGVIFRTRDFPAWRSEAKSKAADDDPATDFAYARPKHLGVEALGLPLLSQLKEGAVPSADGLITAGNGLPPGHPYLDGSGDHVNSTHLSEAATQFLSLCREGKPFRVTGGEMRFTHYVELGLPFTIEQTEQSEGNIAMQIMQNDTPCCIATLLFEEL